MTDNVIDPLHQRIVLGTFASSAIAIERAKQTGTPLVIWRNNHITEIDPSEFISQQPDTKKKP
jgi:hypothetical protein